MSAPQNLSHRTHTHTNFQHNQLGLGHGVSEVRTYALPSARRGHGKHHKGQVVGSCSPIVCHTYPLIVASERGAPMGPQRVSEWSGAYKTRSRASRIVGQPCASFLRTLPPRAFVPRVVSFFPFTYPRMRRHKVSETRNNHLWGTSGVKKGGVIKQGRTVQRWTESGGGTSSLDFQSSEERTSSITNRICGDKLNYKARTPKLSRGAPRLGSQHGGYFRFWFQNF